MADGDRRPFLCSSCCQVMAVFGSLRGCKMPNLCAYHVAFSLRVLSSFFCGDFTKSLLPPRLLFGEVGAGSLFLAFKPIGHCAYFAFNVFPLVPGSVVPYAERILLCACMQPWNAYPDRAATIRYPFDSIVMIVRPFECNLTIEEHIRGPFSSLEASQYR